MNAVAATITAAHQSIPPSKSAARTANHAPDAAVQRRSHRICRTLLGAFLPSVRKLCSRDSALWRLNSSSGSPGAGANPCLERDNRELGLLLMVIRSSSISLRSRWPRKAALTSLDPQIWTTCAFMTPSYMRSIARPATEHVSLSIFQRHPTSALNGRRRRLLSFPRRPRPLPSVLARSLPTVALPSCGPGYNKGTASHGPPPPLSAASSCSKERLLQTRPGCCLLYTSDAADDLTRVDLGG